MGAGAAGALSSSSAAAYVGWKEVFVSSNKGRREVHYYLKKRDGTSVLAVVGKEKSPRHITYRYAVQDMFLIGGSSPSLFLKLRSRREVIDWLSSIVSVDGNTGFGSFDERDVGFLTFGRALKEVQMQKQDDHEKQILWLGSSWTCKKKLKHYQTFSRNGFKISVNDFVFVLAEDNKRLVAHLEDMYEDFQGTKMAVVRWFHRIDEVDIDLPHKFSDREIFFSLCLQDLHIECIDGIATVLSLLDFVKYSNEVRDSCVQPFVCQMLFDDSDIKPFDITQIKGYSSQYVLRCMFPTKVPRTLEKTYSPDHNINVKGLGNPTLMSRPRKRLRLLRDSIIDMQNGSRKSALDTPSCLNGKSNVLREGAFVTEKQPSILAVGCQVEVLSQDSGMRGCWFRASIIKKHKNKIKVRYHDVQDADDEVNNLEEWVLSSRIAVKDDLALRINGRTTVRPFPQPHSGRVTWAFEVGSLVDAWWHDGWWEGIVIHRESDEKVRVYFPGEKREAVFCLGELRHSREWLDSSWRELHGRTDLATKILSDLNSHGLGSKACDNKIEDTSAGSSYLELDHCDKETDDSAVVQDLSKDEFLAQLQWKSSRKRSRAGVFVQKHRRSELKKNTNGLKKLVMHRSNQSFLAPSPAKSLKVDHENCKYIGDSLFNSSVAPPENSTSKMDWEEFSSEHPFVGTTSSSRHIGPDSYAVG